MREEGAQPSVTSPRHTPVSVEALSAIIDRHLPGVSVLPSSPWTGGGSWVYPLGDLFVLKVPHDVPAPIASMAIEAAAVSTAHDAGVRVPRPIAFDDSLDLLPVPYLVYERIHGESLSRMPSPPEIVQRIWRDVGADLATLHTGVQAEGPVRHLPSFPQAPENDPRPWVDEIERFGGLDPTTSRWLRDLLEPLATQVMKLGAPTFCHGDVNAANVMVGPRQPRRYAALVDWGGAGWADPASDFSAMPLSAVPFALAGYRKVAPLLDDATGEARILWFYLRLALFGLRRATMTPTDRAERIERLVGDTRDYLSWARLL